MFYVKPAVPFERFDEHFEYIEHANIMRNLMRYCGYRTLHQDCWLYKWLQTRIRTVKFAGQTEFTQWCTYPAWYSFFEKMRPDKMSVNADQMARWKTWLAEHEDEIRENCAGPAWESCYDPHQQ